MKNIKKALLVASMFVSGTIQATAIDLGVARNDQFNTYNYFKKANGDCVSTTHCKTGKKVTQFKKVGSFSSSQYAQVSGLTQSIDADNDGDLDIIEKYSGTLAFGSHKHAPVAIERPSGLNNGKNYIYFVFSGPVYIDDGGGLTTTANGETSTATEFRLLDTSVNPPVRIKKSPTLGIYVSKYNPETQQVAPPILVHTKFTDDFHDNAVINMDDQGYIYVLISGRNNNRQMILYRSNTPYSMDSFTDITPTKIENTPTAAANGNSQYKMSYPKFFWTDNGYFRLIYNDYDNNGNRDLYSGKLEVYENNMPLATAKLTVDAISNSGLGHYAVGDSRGNEIVIAFNEHSRGIDNRTNLYFIQSFDGGESWHKMGDSPTDQPLSLPLTSGNISSVAVKEYTATHESRSIYVKDIAFGGSGQYKYPEIVVLGIKDAPNANLAIPSKNYDRYFATWYYNHNTDSWQGQRFSNLVDHNYSSAALHQSGQSKVIYAQTPDGQENFLAGGSIAMGNLVDLNHTGGVLAYNVADVSFTDERYCEFNNIRPIHTNAVLGSDHLWAVASGGNMQRYSEHNPIFFIVKDANNTVLKLPSSFDVNSDWVDTLTTKDETTNKTICTY